MAQRTHVQLIDDLDGSTADETVSFGLDGTAYEIDLSSSNATLLRKSLADYVRTVAARLPPASGHASAPLPGPLRPTGST